MAWADYDADGDPDLAVAGLSIDGPITRVFRNDGGSLVDSGIVLPGIYYGSATWGDYDGDGDPDLLVMGTIQEGQDYREIMRLYRNDSGSFSEVFSGLPEISAGASAWGDYDNDGRLDIMLLGMIGRTDEMHAGVYRNLSAAQNTAPQPPTALSATPLSQAGGVRLEWAAAWDGETPAAGLSYNVRVGSTPAGSEVVSPLADPASGYRRVVSAGNAGQRLGLTLPTLPPGEYYWSAQAIDASFAASPLTPTASFVIGGAELATLNVTREGAGSGRVTSVPTGIDCGDICEASFPLNTVIELTAHPDATSIFSGWSGPCAGTGPCFVWLGDLTLVTASFEVLVPQPVTVTVLGAGSVHSSPAGIACRDDCDEAFPTGSFVTLSAVAEPGWAFQGWTGACTGLAECMLLVDGPKAVSATFGDHPLFEPAATLTGVDTGGSAWGD